MTPALTLRAMPAARGSTTLPGSKSISNRVLLLAALASGRTEIHALLDADDTRYMLQALRALGVRLEHDPARGTCAIEGVGGRFPVREADLFLGNAGTAVRPLTAVLALQGGHYRIDGVARMRERPIADLVDGLLQLNADIRYGLAEGYPPLLLAPAALDIPDEIRVRGDVSSQFLSALLLALPNTGEPITVRVDGELISQPYVQLTLNLLRRFGITVRRDGWEAFAIAAASRYRSPGQITVEGDASSASYFLAAGALGGGPVRVNGVDRSSIQGDVLFVDALAAMGAEVRQGLGWLEAARGRTLTGVDLDVNHIPDAAMTLAVLALFAKGRTRLANIGSWRVKETDRLTAMATELRKVGALVEEGDDYLVITPPEEVTPGVAIDTYDDHRMAMCFSLLAAAGVEVVINDPDCVGKTFPDYFNALARLSA
jgi:3-phosphoshikimate 1-carboxyvinyltransferase